MFLTLERIFTRLTMFVKDVESKELTERAEKAEKEAATKTEALAQVRLV